MRDLLLKQIPKDFDVLTTADPKQVENGFSKRVWCSALLFLDSVISKVCNLCVSTLSVVG